MISRRRVMSWWHSGRVVGRRDLGDLVTALGAYLALAVAWTAGAALIRSQLDLASQIGVVVLAEPLAPGVFLSTVIVSLYLALTAALSVARERDLGALQVLFYGPVDAVAYLLGKFMAQATLAGLLMLATGIWVMVYAGLQNLQLTRVVGATLGLGWVVILCLVAGGLLVSTLAQTARGAVLILLAVAGGLLAVQTAFSVVTQWPLDVTSTSGDPRLYLRAVLGVAQAVARWLSPYAYLSDGMAAIQAGDLSGYWVALGRSLLLTLGLLVGAIARLHHRGAAG